MYNEKVMLLSVELSLICNYKGCPVLLSILNRCRRLLFELKARDPSQTGTWSLYANIYACASGGLNCNSLNCPSGFLLLDAL